MIQCNFSKVTKAKIEKVFLIVDTVKDKLRQFGFLGGKGEIF